MKRKPRRATNPALARLNHLPLPAPYVRQASLANHLAFEACCAAAGSRHALNRMSGMLYLGYLIWEAEGEPGPADCFHAAEAVLDAAVQRAEGSGIWRLEPPDRAALTGLLCLHDTQLATIPTRVYLGAMNRLERLLHDGEPMSPLPERGQANGLSGDPGRRQS
ncbi:hypothetical protein [Burkholderia sp. ISTR5]|uniref:hypothetical protein n=1 Tax=Burkholderia sp. ISTR5 TaxID=2500161 RepID=UPI001371F127|nr:hypothetical protein [Burkholderia sp. ISTR5]NBI44029.1 hypothetical protein [Burkholderia sp. ISTR5]